MVRGKFRVDKITRHAWSKEAGEVTLSAVCDDGIEENARYAKFTPSGSITMMIDNPPALAAFELGAEVYVDFTPVPKA